ncbi:cell division cycle protein 16 homolog [Aricia agestis]|uniref:cell division cycle protein 16 homolog n=1 Tax=Aricia agestis TaxID=91739 RepID=UPI001C2038A0|nr:cell division cycle protein 16 homolog [Aricia agestis]
MAKAESTGRSTEECLNVDYMRSLVKQYSELGQWTSAFFWADAAAASCGAEGASGDDMWLLSSAMLARGELHRAANAVMSRDLHKRHLLCLGVAMRAFISAKEPQAALNLLEECEPPLLEVREMDQTHNRALAGVLVWQARALSALERREASAVALTAALKADCACYEALDLLLEQHALTPENESELIDSLPINHQMNLPEATLLKTAYRERLLRYSPLHMNSDNKSDSSPTTEMGVSEAVRRVRARSVEGAESRARRLAAAGSWADALKALDAAGGGAPAVRAACLVELRRSADLFAFAHSLVDAYPQTWTSWYAVGLYYYLIGKSEVSRRYLSKACALEAGAGCVWLAYGHSFAADNEHDQAMAAYFKACQLMPGSYLPPLYVGVECSLLNNVSMCERFMVRAADLHSYSESGVTVCATESGGGGWERLAARVRSAHVAHEAGAAAFAAGDPRAAHALWRRALALAAPPGQQLESCWAATLDALGHASRALGRAAEALRWHEQALALRPARAASLAAAGLCLALLGREARAADCLHAALARDPDHAVAAHLLDAVMDRVDSALSEEEIPQFPFPAVQISAPPAADPDPDATNTSDMSMSFD